MWHLTVKLILAYALGSLVGALIIGRFKGVDIRTQGSGNAGGTNALRTQGKLFALGVMAIDVGKGALVTGWLAPFDFYGALGPASLPQPWLTGVLAIAVILGHIYPVFYGFKGGKGAATLVGALAGGNLTSLIPLLVVFWSVVFVTGFVGLATMLSTLSLCLIPNLPAEWGLVMPWPLEIMALISALIVFAHRGNVWRMIQGTENRAKKAWLLRPRHRD
jgi:glycerol-3-phosphate acyltransferase PlsY